MFLSCKSSTVGSDCFAHGSSRTFSPRESGLLSGREIWKFQNIINNNIPFFILFLFFIFIGRLDRIASRMAHLERSIQGSQVCCPDEKSGKFKILLIVIFYFLFHFYLSFLLSRFLFFILFFIFIGRSDRTVSRMAHLGRSNQGSQACCPAEKSEKFKILLIMIFYFLFHFYFHSTVGSDCFAHGSSRTFKPDGKSGENYKNVLQFLWISAHGRIPCNLVPKYQVHLAVHLGAGGMLVMCSRAEQLGHSLP